jgi:trans-AT polyketide synthase, acyltransferase and oxidoreductase domains
MNSPAPPLLSPLRPECLGDRSFCADHRLRYAYVAGAMANGIASTALVEAMGRAGMLGFFGAAGLSLGRVEAAMDQLTGTMGDAPFGFNLIHSPNEADL